MHFSFRWLYSKNCLSHEKFAQNFSREPVLFIFIWLAEHVFILSLKPMKCILLSVSCVFFCKIELDYHLKSLSTNKIVFYGNARGEQFQSVQRQICIHFRMPLHLMRYYKQLLPFFLFKKKGGNMLTGNVSTNFFFIFTGPNMVILVT